MFTRVGASDDIAGGRSTFMIEMTELATILTAATADSLVLLDEVGRGTSTADGLALAQAVVEQLHDVVGATTLFATHHHALTEAADRLPRAKNYHFAADGSGGEVSFSHELKPGAASGSYGIEVARSAGVPDPVVSRAHELLEREAGEKRKESEETALPEGVVGQLHEVDLAQTTPLEALELLSELKSQLE